MKALLRCSLALLLFLPLGCRSGSSASGADLPCTCGTAEADLVGCAHAACLDGERNPDNPDCVCGGLTFEK